MPLQNRIAECDVCGVQEVELRTGEGWKGWAIIQGIGACAPINEPLQPKHLEFYLCPRCKLPVTGFLTKLQEEHK